MKKNSTTMKLSKMISRLQLVQNAWWLGLCIQGPSVVELPVWGYEARRISDFFKLLLNTNLKKKKLLLILAHRFISIFPTYFFCFIITVVVFIVIVGDFIFVLFCFYFNCLILFTFINVFILVQPYKALSSFILKVLYK